MSGISLITAATSEIITLSEAKTHLRVFHDDDDDYIERLVTHVVSIAESRMNRALLSSVWELVIDAFKNEIEIPKGKVTAISYVKYLDENGVYQTLSSSYYEKDLVSEPARIVLARGYSYPIAQKNINNVKIGFTAGWESVDDIPKGIIQILYFHLSVLYDQRSPIVIGTSANKVPDTIDGLYSMFKINTFY